MFDRKRPCTTCPFLTGRSGLRYLGRSRAEEIATALLRDWSFTCHSDLEKPESERQHCAGAAILLEKLNRPNQMMRIFERFGGYDRHALSGHAEVFDSFDDWIDCQSHVTEIDADDDDDIYAIASSSDDPTPDLDDTPF